MPGKNSASIKDWPEDERSRERLIKYGGSSMSDAHFLGILIGSGDLRARNNAVDLSRDLLNKFETFESIDQASITEICQIQGIGTVKTTQIKAALEVGKRMAAKTSGKKIKMKSSRVFLEYFSLFLKNLKKEIVKIVLLNPKLQLVKEITISEGSLNASIVRADSQSSQRRPETNPTGFGDHPQAQ